MLFSSLTFLLAFLPLFLALYYVVPMRWKNGVILLFSLVFYAWGEPVYIFLMLYSIVFNYLLGREMDANPEKKKETLVFAVALNLFVLGFFKYYGFLIENINALLHVNIPIRKLALPIGISFYTFQTLSYIIDLYRGKIAVQKNIVNFAAYITMFPQLIAGPIVRYSDVEKELSSRRIDLEGFGRGCQIFLFGLSQKVLLANGIGALFDRIQAAGDQISVMGAWMGALAYTFQIYFDFCGYSTMAIGLGEMMGFHFMKNFDHPYISTSVTEFWRRWHISLGAWFREYVYIPLGGNRVGVAKHVRNILVVWLLTGLWHGASWNFIFWGGYYGVLLLIDKYLWQKLPIPKAVNYVLTMVLVVIGWVFFSAESMAGAITTLKAMMGSAALGLSDAVAIYEWSTHWILFGLCAFFSLPLAGKWKERLQQWHPLALGMMSLGLFLLCLASLITQNYNPFLYFRF